jgi:hypothetical protein
MISTVFLLHFHSLIPVDHRVAGSINPTSDTEYMPGQTAFLLVSFRSDLSSPVTVPHAQDLNHPDEDVQKVQLKTDALVDNILSDEAALAHASMVQNLLDIVQGESTEHS